jgi:hypothetical protein
MCKEDLRPATRKASDDFARRPSARLNPGEKLNRKRMASVAAVYSIEAHERSSETIMRLSSSEGKPTRPRAANKRVWASVEREQEDVIEDISQEALWRDPERKRPWAILVDGAKSNSILSLALSVGIDRIRPLSWISSMLWNTCGKRPMASMLLEALKSRIGCLNGLSRSCAERLPV